MDDAIFAYHCQTCQRVLDTRQTGHVCCGEPMRAIRGSVAESSSLWGAVWLAAVLALLGWLLFEIGAQVARVY